MVILNGAGSRKENHGDFARACSASGWAALGFDQRGHGASEDGMSPAALGRRRQDGALPGRGWKGVDTARVCVRGSSMGGFLAIHAAAAAEQIAGAIAICPAWGGPPAPWATRPETARDADRPRRGYERWTRGSQSTTWARRSS